MRAWSDYFTQANGLYGLDVVDAKEACRNMPHVITAVCDQGDREELEDVVEETFGANFDIVVDDASHDTGNTLRCLGFLFGYLSKDGIYCIEDLHVAPHTLSFLKSLQAYLDSGEKPRNQYFTLSEFNELLTECNSVEFFCGDKLAVLTRKGD